MHLTLVSPGGDAGCPAGVRASRRRAVKFAVQHGVGDPKWSPAVLAPDAVRSFAQAAEDTGWSAIAFTDHPAPSSRWVHGGGEGSSDPFGSLAFCAAVTRSIRLLTWVLVLPYRNPLLTAHQIATLDVLSAGRLTLGLGTGYLRGEFRGLGADFEHRRELFDEAVEVLSAGWTQDEVAVEGREFTAPGTVLQPRPVQLPRPPLWLHGNGAWATERAARYGDGWFATMTTDVLARTIRTTPMPDLAAVRAGIQRLHKALERHGRPRDAVEVAVSGNLPLLDVRVGWDADAVRAQVAELESLGVTWVVANVIGDDPAASEDTVRRFAADVITPS
jgi:probable F420-dependent oxidoreductase